MLQGQLIEKASMLCLETSRKNNFEPIMFGSATPPLAHEHVARIGQNGGHAVTGRDPRLKNFPIELSDAEGAAMLSRSFPREDGGSAYAILYSAF